MCTVTRRATGSDLSAEYRNKLRCQVACRAGLFVIQAILQSEIPQLPLFPFLLTCRHPAKKNTGILSYFQEFFMMCVCQARINSSGERETGDILYAQLRYRLIGDSCCRHPPCVFINVDPTRALMRDH